MTESIAETGAQAAERDRPERPERPARVVALDVLRGIAILGTLGTNIWILTNPEGLIGYIDELGAATDGGWMWTERVLQQLAQGKFLGLLTIMFGIGLAIQQASAVRRGRAWPGSYPWRAGLLFLDGLLNFVLVAEFDVLMGYAVTGLVVAFVLATGERAQRRWLTIAASVHVAMLTLIALAMAFAPQQDSAPRAPLDPNPYADGSFWDLVVFRLDNALAFRLEAVFVFAMSVALFLAGARLYRAGLFGPEGARIRKRLMVIGAIAAPIDFLVGVFVGGDLVLLTRYGSAPFVAFGILALVAEFYLRRPRLGFAGRRLTEVGRTALSCYILQNLVASALCYGWGLGLAARVSPDARVPFTIAIYLVVSVIIVTAAHLWLRRFERGPVEWAWHASYRVLARER
ncbi:DUF418 domain-containing protein [Nocardia amikacinitolerans]|uniref:DUF418 domain-containing protein n=1 Tax=Nocardia amikacinitolerans TaxID=756689 RepID=UPI0020A3261C|nr:DUF418 domain-containing protein [Nocardia amikacinitolerans]MCP2277943.1 uncharacterized protein [Nocardia amikacinitolerans]MCP2297719.1 uncharacterized protein [Nocardia amikacinitolerans]